VISELCCSELVLFNEWKPNLVFKHFMVSAIYASSLNVLVTSGAAKLTWEHWWNLLDFFCDISIPLCASQCYRSFSRSS